MPRASTNLPTNEYNARFSRPTSARLAILQKLLGAVGERVHSEPTFRCEFGQNIDIGNNFHANLDCVMLDGGGISIGDDVLLAPRGGIYTTHHAIDPKERAAGTCHARPVRIGDRVWIGAGVQINPGVVIGDGSIGPGSTVTKDVQAGVIAAGVPRRLLRSIEERGRVGFDPDQF
ncbi:sugar O-acetyltransferase [Variovorax robiniae]|uniref:Acetyltransferase n=1 Tax=Variovorax robiniae TaxID=1836199 RepID=A0ABU8XJ89_9BURK